MMNDDDHCQELATTSTQCLAAFICAGISRGCRGGVGGYVPSVLGSAHYKIHFRSISYAFLATIRCPGTRNHALTDEMIRRKST